ncbi:hypothetical protein DY000_02004550 [Brassica cretica]|uniref:Uncharacterized protein n=1 Tax=Brassica cretica TaxID=69181 RepID=A0ABQ7BSF9_BRACR|nr:hypothetical protein DY000_02004550 [Brassica cretica]
MQSQQGLLGRGLKVEENKSFDFSLDRTKRFKTRSTSFALLRRRSRRRNPPALMAKKKNSKKPPTKPYPTGSGSSHSVLKQSMPEIPSAVNSEIQTKQADLGLSSASSGPTSPSEPSMPASVTIAASTPKLTETLTSATVASALQASVPEQTVDPSTSTQLGLIEKVQPTTATLDGPSGKSLPATSSSADLDPASKWRRFVSKTPSKMEPEQTPFTLESGEACVKIPNSVIERNKKAWDSFILGQFYEEPPAKEPSTQL